jgi:hypothetical protein
MYTELRVHEMIEQRGPRWVVRGNTRPGEYRASYAVTAEAAESLRERFEGDGLYQVAVTPPEGSWNLGRLGRERDDAREALRDATEKLKAAAIAAVNGEGRAEAEVARQSGIDRMTLRDWLGKPR